MIRIVCDAEEKRRIARLILESLTDWFGIPEARETYIGESADEMMVASFDNGERICINRSYKKSFNEYLLKMRGIN